MQKSTPARPETSATSSFKTGVIASTLVLAIGMLPSAIAVGLFAMSGVL